MDFERLCMAFTLREPYYGILLSSMNKEANPLITDTMGVARCGNVFRLYYNPAFVQTLTDEQAIDVLKHEMLHLAFSHFTLFDDEPEELNRELKNYAADMEVNGYIRQQTIDQLGLVSPADYGWDWRLGGREYLKRLRALQQQQKAQAQQPQKPCNGGLGGNGVPQVQGQGNNNQQQQNQQQQQSQSPQSQQQQQSQSNDSQQNNNGQGGQNNNQIPKDNKGSIGKSIDDHNNWPNSDQSKNEMLEQMVEDLLVFAADEVEKNHGTIPGELVGKIGELRKKNVRPIADWKRFFRRYLGNEFTEMIRKSKKRESRRFPDAAGNRHRRKSHILVAIDTSGSVSMPEYMEFFSQIRTLTRAADFHVVECDARIQYEYDYRLHPNKTLHGGGGTDFQPPVDMFNENKRKYDALVYFTDGGAPIPNDTPKDTLWVISSNGDHNKERYKINGAKSVFIPQHN